MKKIILAILLLPLYAYSQTFDIVTSISRDGCDLNFFNATGVRIASLNLNEVNFWNKSDGSYFIKDNKLQVNVTKQLTNPSFAGLANYLILVKDSCITTGGGTVSITTPLETVDSGNVTTVKRCFYGSDFAWQIGASPYDVIEQVLMYKTTGAIPTLYYERWYDVFGNFTIYEAFADGTTTGTLPSVGQHVIPCDKVSDYYERVYVRVEDPSYNVSYTFGDFVDDYTLTLGIANPSPLDGFVTVDWGDGMTEILVSNPNPEHRYSKKGKYDVKVSFGVTFDIRAIKFSIYFDDNNLNTAGSSNLYTYQPIIARRNSLVGIQYFGMYDMVNPINPTGTILTEAEYIAETDPNPKKNEDYKVNKIVGYASMAIGEKDQMQKIVQNYLVGQEGIEQLIQYAKKITITNIDQDAGTIMHIGNEFITDNHTPYGLKEGYTFYQNGLLYDMSEIWVYNNSTSPRDLEFSFEVEY